MDLAIDSAELNCGLGAKYNSARDYLMTPREYRRELTES